MSDRGGGSGRDQEAAQGPPSTGVRRAGANPIPASSGQVTRHRLNRSGDRRLNRALHTIVVARLRDDPDTRAYAARRRSQGKSARDVRRCLKRAVARQLFKLLEQLDRPGVELASIW
jgi:transposase